MTRIRLGVVACSTSPQVVPAVLTAPTLKEQVSPGSAATGWVTLELPARPTLAICFHAPLPLTKRRIRCFDHANASRARHSATSALKILLRGNGCLAANRPSARSP